MSVALERLIDLLVEDIMETSDEEIAREFMEDYADPELELKKTRAVIDGAVDSWRRRNA